MSALLNIGDADLGSIDLSDPVDWDAWSLLGPRPLIWMTSLPQWRGRSQMNLAASVRTQHGELQGGALWSDWTRPGGGGSVLLDASDDYVHIPTADQLSNTLTIIASIRIESYAGSAFGQIWAVDSNDPSSPSIATEAHGISVTTSGVLTGVVNWDGGVSAGNRTQLTGNTLNSFTWYRVGLTVSASGQATLYCDGRAVGSSTFTNIGLHSPSRWRIGKLGTDAFGGYFGGRIDNVMVSGYCLSADQIAADHTLSLAGYQEILRRSPGRSYFWVGTASGTTITTSSITSAEAFGTASLTHWIAPSAISGGEAFGTAALSQSQSLAPTGIAGAEAFGTAALAPAIAAGSINSAEAFGTAVISTENTIICAGIDSAEAFGSHALSFTIFPSAIDSAEAFGSHALSFTIFPSAIGSAGAFGTAVISTENAVICAGIDSAEAFGSHALSYTIFPSAIGSAEAFGTAIIFGSDTIVASGISSGEAFGTARLDLSITASGIAGAEAFGTASLGLGVTTQAISGGEAFGTAALSEALIITATGIATGEAFGSASLGHVMLAQAIAGAEAFGTAVLTIQGEADIPVTATFTIVVESPSASLRLA